MEWTEDCLPYPKLGWQKVDVVVKSKLSPWNGPVAL